MKEQIVLFENDNSLPATPCTQRTFGCAWTGNGWRPFTRFKEITKGKDKGKFHVYFFRPGSERDKRLLLEASDIKYFPGKEV